MMEPTVSFRKAGGTAKPGEQKESQEKKEGNAFNRQLFS
jgi:hypothetical protein